MELNKGESGRVKVGDKRLINAVSDVNQLVPFKYRWAWDMYLTNSNNHWMPQETNMGADKALFAKEQPKVIENIKRALAAIVFIHTYSKGDISQSIYRIMTAPECRQFMLRQLFEESLDTHVVDFVCNEFGIPLEEIIDLSYSFAAYNSKYEPFMNFAQSADFETSTPKGVVEFFKLFTAVNIGAKVVRSHAAYVYVTEFLPVGYRGLKELFKKLLATNISHANFAAEFIATMKYENPICSSPITAEQIYSQLQEMATDEAHMFGYYGTQSNSVFASYLNYRVTTYAKKIGVYNNPAHVHNPIPGTDDLPGVKHSHDAQTASATNVNTGLEW
jgi:ribonucleoside-diphosphate reductase beta chain